MQNHTVLVSSRCDLFQVFTSDTPLPHPAAPHTRSAGTDCFTEHFLQTGLFVSILLADHRLV